MTRRRLTRRGAREHVVVSEDSSPESGWAVCLASSLSLLLAIASSNAAQRQMENLTRGLVAVRETPNRVYVGWRLFGTDPESLAFNLYRAVDGGSPVRVNATPIAAATDYLDCGVAGGRQIQYFLRPLWKGKELSASAAVTAWDHNYLDIPIEPIAEYQPGDASVGDLIGDWREELLTVAPSGRALRLYTTTTPSQHRLPTLMHDPQYRSSMALQNVAYNKPPHPGFFLGAGMAHRPRPKIRLVGSGEAVLPDH